MDAELATSIAGFMVLLASGLLWIIIDAETVYIFDVFGRSYRSLWQFRHPWRLMLPYAWRLLILAVLIGGASWLAITAAIRRWDDAHYRTAILLSTFAIIPFLLIPWISLASTLRWHRLLSKTTSRLAPVARQLADEATAVDSGRVRERISGSWTAWYADDMEIWPEVYPTAYVQPQRAIVYFQLRSPYFKEYFLAWSSGTSEFPVGTLLPLSGFEEIPYRISEAWPLPHAPNWTLVDCELLLSDEDLFNAPD